MWSSTLPFVFNPYQGREELRFVLGGVIHAAPLGDPTSSSVASMPSSGPRAPRSGPSTRGFSTPDGYG